MQSKHGIRKTIALVVLVMAVLATLAVACTRDVQEMGVTNLSSLHLSDTGGTATPVFIADQQGLGAIAVFEDAGTPVASIYDGGASAWSGAATFSGGTASALTVNGQGVVNGVADADAANYDHMFTIEYAMTGTGTKDRNYGLLVEGTRAAGQEVSVGDHDEAGIKVRVDTHAVTTTAGTVLRGMDIEAKADNPGGTVTNLYGAALTAKSDMSAGDVGTMIALTTNAQNNAAVNDALMSADFRLMRQAATEPTEEYVIRIRNSSTTGSGADAAIYVTSDYSDTVATDNFDYGIDFSTADINIAAMCFENGTTLAEDVDTVLTFSEFLAAEEQTAEVVSAGSTIVPTGTYQPLTSTGSVTTSTSNAIADGTKVGQLLILVNENSSDTITIDDGANTRLSGDAVLGNDDSLMLIWDGADWLEIAQVDTT